MSIPVGAGVRHRKTRMLGEVFTTPKGLQRGHVTVQWDCDRNRGDRKLERLEDVEYVARRYESAKQWDEAEATSLRVSAEIAAEFFPRSQKLLADAIAEAEEAARD